MSFLNFTMLSVTVPESSFDEDDKDDQPAEDVEDLSDLSTFLGL